MELAIFHPWLKERGGAERLVLEYARRSEHDVTVHTLHYQPGSTFEGFEEVDVVDLERRPPRGWADGLLRFGLGNLLLDLEVEDCDLLLLSETGLAAPAAFRNSGIPVHSYVHTPLRAALPEFRDSYRSELVPLLRPLFDVAVRVYGAVERLSWRRIDSATANSELTRERMLSRGLIDLDRIDVLNPGVELRDEDELGGHGDYFLYPSRFRRYKRQHLALEAFEEADTGGMELVLAGSAQEEDYVDELRERAGKDVRVLTDVPGGEWEQLYRDAHSVVFLPEAEDFGIVPLEAATWGKPVIAADEGSPSETVDHGETGLLVDAEAEEVAGAMEELASDPDRLTDMGETALERVRDRSWDRFAERLDRRLEEAKSSEV